jgi:hypothetical protein
MRFTGEIRTPKKRQTSRLETEDMEIAAQAGLRAGVVYANA